MGQIFSPAVLTEEDIAELKRLFTNRPAAERLKEVTRLEVDRVMALWYWVPEDVTSVTTHELFESVRCGEDDEAVEARIAVAIRMATDNLIARRKEVGYHKMELDKEDRNFLQAKEVLREKINAQKLRKESLLRRKEEKVEVIQDIDKKMMELAGQLQAHNARYPAIDIEKKRLGNIRKGQETEGKVIVRLRKALEDRRG